MKWLDHLSNNGDVKVFFIKEKIYNTLSLSNLYLIREYKSCYISEMRNYDEIADYILEAAGIKKEYEQKYMTYLILIYIYNKILQEKILYDKMLEYENIPRKFLNSFNNSDIDID